MIKKKLLWLFIQTKHLLLLLQGGPKATCKTLSLLTDLSQLSGISYAPKLLRSYPPYSVLLVKNDLLDLHSCKPLSGKKRCRTLCLWQDLLCTTNSFLKTVISKCFVSFCHSMNLVPFTYSISCVFGSIYKLICYF